MRGERLSRRTLPCRMHRIVDASLFCLSAKETAGKFSDPWSAGVMSNIQKGACAIQLLAMVITFLAPRFCKERHEVLKASLCPPRKPLSPTQSSTCWPCISGHIHSTPKLESHPKWCAAAGNLSAGQLCNCSLWHMADHHHPPALPDTPHVQHPVQRDQLLAGAGAFLP